MKGLSVRMVDSSEEQMSNMRFETAVYISGYTSRGPHMPQKREFDSMLSPGMLQRRVESDYYSEIEHITLIDPQYIKHFVDLDLSKVGGLYISNPVREHAAEELEWLQLKWPHLRFN